jgi:hypothetical protein
MFRVYFHAIAPPLDGVCDVCGEQTLLKVADRSSGCRVGDCCYPALLVAHHHLNAWGLRHPKPHEFREQDNH